MDNPLDDLRHGVRPLTPLPVPANQQTKPIRSLSTASSVAGYLKVARGNNAETRLGSRLRLARN